MPASVKNQCNADPSVSLCWKSGGKNCPFVKGWKCPEHNCMEYAAPYISDGPLGHGWECGLCGKLLQVG